MQTTTTRRLIRMSELTRIVGLGRSAIYDRIARGEFPAGRQLGGGLIAWDSADVEAWIDARPYGTGRRPVTPDSDLPPAA